MNTDKIASIFKNEGYAWKFSDGTRIPTEEEIAKTIWAGIDALAQSEDGTQIEVGRLIVKRSGSKFDVYIHIAEQSVEAPKAIWP